MITSSRAMMLCAGRLNIVPFRADHIAWVRRSSVEAFKGQRATRPGVRSRGVRRIGAAAIASSIITAELAWPTSRVIAARCRQPDRSHRIASRVNRKPDLEIEMIASRSRHAVSICAAVALAGCWAMEANAQSEMPTKPAQTKVKKASTATHKVAIQVTQNDKAVMDLALNNAGDIMEYYKGKGETVIVEIVAYGP